MPARIVLTPNTVTARRADAVPNLNYRFVYPFEKGGGSVFHGADVRVVVYDKEMYGASPLCAAEGGLANFTKGDSDAPVLSDDPLFDHTELGTVFNPSPADGSGVLLSFDGQILKHATEPLWWFQRGANPRQYSGKAATFVLLRMPLNEPDARASSVSDFAQIPIPVGASPRRLLMRVALITARGGLPERSVIASNLSPQHNPAVPPGAGNPHLLGAVLVDGAAILKNAPPKVGGREEDAPQKPPSPFNRVLPQDLTGLYALGIPVENPPLFLHLNQAGHALVGWFTRPKSSNLVPLTDPPDILPRPGWLATDDLSAPDRVAFNWGLQEKRPTNNQLNTGDPDDAYMAQALPNQGTFRRITGRDAGDLDFTFQEEGAGEVKSVTLRAHRIEAGGRWPWKIIDHRKFVTRAARNALILAQVRPFPELFWKRLCDSMDGSARIAKARTLKEALQDWIGKTSDADKNKIADEIADHLKALLAEFQLDPAKDGVVARLRHCARTHEITVASGGGDLKRSCEEWMELLVAQELKRLTSINVPDERLAETLQEGFHLAGYANRVAHRFAYKLHVKAEAKIPVIPIVSHYFELITTVDKLSSGPAGVKTPVKEWVDAGQDKVNLVGHLYSVGVAAGLEPPDEKKGKRPKLGWSWAEVLPDEIEFESFQDLTLDDFHDATIHITAFSVLRFNAFGAKGAATIRFYVQLRLRNGLYIETEFGRNLEKDFPELEDADPSDIPGGDLFSVAHAWGKLSDKLPSGERPPSDGNDRERIVTMDVENETPVLFSKDSSILEDRAMFEVRLATAYKLFTVGGEKAKDLRSALALGYASPEGTSQHNLVLSERRAVAVRTACEDAFGPMMSFSAFVARGFGEEPATTETKLPGGRVVQLLDPETAEPTEANKARIKQEAATEYSKWRAVHLYIQSFLVIRAVLREEQKPGGKPPAPVPPGDFDKEPESRDPKVPSDDGSPKGDKPPDGDKSPDRDKPPDVPSS